MRRRLLWLLGTASVTGLLACSAFEGSSSSSPSVDDASSPTPSPGPDGGGVEALSDAAVDAPADASADAATELCPRSTCRFVFVTSRTYAGVSLGGDAADRACADGALTGALGVGTFKAWLSQTGASAGSRLPAGEVQKILLPNGKLVASSYAQLKAGMLVAPIDRDELGRPIGAGAPAWTGSNADGTSAVGCTDWTDPTGAATYGNTSSTSPTWSNAGTASCVDVYRVYCIGTD